jgi:hypothetical protein
MSDTLNEVLKKFNANSKKDISQLKKDVRMVRCFIFKL